MIEGQFFQSGTSQGEPAELTSQGDSLLLVSKNASRIIKLDTLVISRRLARIPRRLSFPDGSVFTTLQNEQLDTTLRSLGVSPQSSWIDYFESGWHWTLLALIVIPVFLFMLFTIGLPVVSGPIASLVPEDVKHDIDAKSVDFLDDIVLQPSNLTSERQEALNNVFTKASVFSPGKHRQLLFRSGGYLGANALALPGGTIIFTDELVQLAENDGELVAVYAHELGHVVNNHSLRNLVQTTGVAFVLGWMLGDLTMITDVMLVGAPVFLQQMSYSRGFETEADEFAMMVLDVSRYSRTCFANIIEKLSAQHAEMGFETSYLSSHPAPGQRVAFSRTDQPCADERVEMDNNEPIKQHPELIDDVHISPPLLPPGQQAPDSDYEPDLSEGEYHAVNKVAPEYPREALIRGIQGYCVVEYTVAADGRVEDPVVIEGECTSPYFAEPALAAARAFRYKPRVENNQAIAVPGVQNKFTFEIVDNGTAPIKPPYSIEE